MDQDITVVLAPEIVISAEIAEQVIISTEAADQVVTASEVAVPEVQASVIPEPPNTTVVINQGPPGPKGDQGDQGIQGPPGTGFNIDAFGDAAGRAAYDDEAFGFTYLDNVNSLLYFKLSAAHADWSPGSVFGKGDQGDPGPKGDTGDPGPKGDQGDQGPPGTSFAIDAIGVTADRSLYDSEVAGFVFLDSTLSLLYMKQSATPGDWSIGSPFGKGEKGDPGEAGPQGNDGPPGLSYTGPAIYAQASEPVGVADGTIWIDTSQ